MYPSLISLHLQFVVGIIFTCSLGCQIIVTKTYLIYPLGWLLCVDCCISVWWPRVVDCCIVVDWLLHLWWPPLVVRCTCVWWPRVVDCCIYDDLHWLFAAHVYDGRRWLIVVSVYTYDGQQMVDCWWLLHLILIYRCIRLFVNCCIVYVAAVGWLLHVERRLICGECNHRFVDISTNGIIVSLIFQW